MQLPELPMRGSQITAAWGAQIVTYLRAITPRGPGVATGPSGTTITGGFGRSRPQRTYSPPTPFKLRGEIVAAVPPSPAAAFITVFPGLVNNIVPKIGSVSLVTVPAPKITVTGATGQVWLKCTLDANGEITEVIVDTGETMPDDSDEFAYRLLGSFTSASGQFTNIWSALQTNQAHGMCAGINRWARA